MSKALLVLEDGRVAVTVRDQNQVVLLEPTEVSAPLEVDCIAAV